MGDRSKPARRADDRFRDFVEELDVIFWEADATGTRFTFVSPHADRILGYPTRRWIEDATFWEALVHPEDRARVAELHRAHITAGLDHEFEFRALASDGRVVWLRNIVRLVRNGAEVVNLRGVMIDVS